MLEILEDTSGGGSTVIVSQLPIASWFVAIAAPTIADAIKEALSVDQCRELIYHTDVATLASVRSGVIDFTETSHGFAPKQLIDLTEIRTCGRPVQEDYRDRRLLYVAVHR